MIASLVQVRFNSICWLISSKIMIQTKAFQLWIRRMHLKQCQWITSSHKLLKTIETRQLRATRWIIWRWATWLMLIHYCSHSLRAAHLIIKVGAWALYKTTLASLHPIFFSAINRVRHTRTLIKKEQRRTWSTNLCTSQRVRIPKVFVLPNYSNQVR